MNTNTTGLDDTAYKLYLAMKAAERKHTDSLSFDGAGRVTIEDKRARGWAQRKFSKLHTYLVSQGMNDQEIITALTHANMVELDRRIAEGR